MSKIHILVGLISNRNERPRTREGNFPFTARENAADRGVAAVKPRSSGRYEFSRYLGCVSIASGGKRLAERRISLRGSYESYYRFVRRRGLAAAGWYL